MGGTPGLRAAAGHVGKGAARPRFRGGSMTSESGDWLSLRA